MFLQSFWPELASLGPAGSSLGLHIFLKKLAKNRVFGNMSKNKHVKTQGFWTVDSQKPCISLHFLVAKWNFPGFLLDHLAPWIASWTHPPSAGPENGIFHTKTVLARSHFRRADQIEILGMFEGFRSGQNLAKYMIHAVFQCFEALKTLQHTWFTLCFNAWKSSKPCKMRDSRSASLLRSVQKLAKYVIHALFHCLEVFKALQNTWFTLCCTASKRSKTRKIHDSRPVSLPHSAQNLAKNVIHAVFL